MQVLCLPSGRFSDCKAQSGQSRKVLCCEDLPAGDKILLRLAQDAPFFNSHTSCSHSALLRFQLHTLVMPYSSLVLVAGLSVFLATTALVAADPISVIESCYNTGCGAAFTILEPCGGGITNSSLQQDLVYTPTESLGGCECNTYFYDLFASCLSCVSTLGQNKPEIQNLDDWTNACRDNGYNMTTMPIVTSANPTANEQSSGLSKGAIIGIVIGALALLALVVVLCFLKGRGNRKAKSDVSKESGVTSAAAAGASWPAATGPESQYLDTDGDGGIYPPPGNVDLSDLAGQQQYPSDYYNGYYGGGKDEIPMTEEIISNGSYVPPPPHPPQVGSTAPVSGYIAASRLSDVSLTGTTPAAVYMAASRPSDSSPQSRSLRSRPTGWDQEKQGPNSSLISMEHTLGDKAEIDDDELERPSRSRFATGDDYRRRSITPPRATYRDDLRRPSFEREPRPSGGSDRGSISAVNMLRVESSGGDAEQYDPPGSARRRAHAAELFSAESTRR